MMVMHHPRKRRRSLLLLLLLCSCLSSLTLAQDCGGGGNQVGGEATDGEYYEPHADCDPNEYCSLGPGLPGEASSFSTSATTFPRCRHCSNCNDNLTHLLDPNRDPQDDPIDGACPLKCGCTSHTDCMTQVATGEPTYCSHYSTSAVNPLSSVVLEATYGTNSNSNNLSDSDNTSPQQQPTTPQDDDMNVCLSCQHCGVRAVERRGIEYPFDASGTCPQHCLCRTNADCLEGSYCARQHPTSLTPQLDQQGKPVGLCMACDSSVGCMERLMVERYYTVDENNSNDTTSSSLPTCREACPSTHECDAHQDCLNVPPFDEIYSNSTSNNTQADKQKRREPWCSQNHLCHECDPPRSTCWSHFRLPPDSPYHTLTADQIQYLREAYTSDTSSVGTDNLIDEWHVLPHLSIDFACPQYCCDWTSNLYTNGVSRYENDYWKFSTEPVVLGLCDPNKTNLQAYWTDGHEAANQENNGTSSAWTTRDFVEQGTPCDMTPYGFSDEHHPIEVYVVSCPGISESCQRLNRTMALMYEHAAEVTQTEQGTTTKLPDDQGQLYFFEPFPVAAVLDRTSLRCAMSNVADGVAAPIFAGIAFFLLLLMIVAGAVYCCGCYRPHAGQRRGIDNNKLDQEEQAELLVGSAAAAAGVAAAAAAIPEEEDNDDDEEEPAAESSSPEHAAAQDPVVVESEESATSPATPVVVAPITVPIGEKAAVTTTSSPDAAAAAASRPSSRASTVSGDNSIYFV